MRHASVAGLTRERFGERALAGEENGRGQLRELVEIADQVRLIEVTAFYSDIRPSRVRLVDRAEHLLKSDDAREQFRTDADFPQKATLELTRANAGVRSKLIYGDESAAIDHARGEC